MKNLTKKYPILGSSENPDKISMTIKGLGFALVPAIVAIGRAMGADIVEAELVQLVNALATFTSLVFVIYGGIRKLVLKFK